MHGISPEQFASQVGALLGPYYIALAAMNAIMAFYLWQKTEPATLFLLKLAGGTLSVTTAWVWTKTTVRPGFVCISLKVGSRP